MVLEATMIVVDNSEPARNGDYVPSRWEAQRDAASLIFHTKTQSNPESSVGLLSMGGQGPEVLTTLTTNFGNILDGLHRTKIGGAGCFFGRGINIASLALKHRQNKSQRQRVVVFVCSPIEEEKGALVKLAKRMKKIGLNIDVVAFGDLTDDNLEKLQAFNEAIKGSDGSHLEVVQPSGNLLSDVIVASPILAGDNANGANGGGANGVPGADGGAGGGGDFEFGVDPNVDPELALVLRMSLQEEEERQRVRREQEGAAAQPNLESVPEEGKEEEQPLLDANGEASGSAEAEKPDEKKDAEGGDKMDTA